MRYKTKGSARKRQYYEWWQTEDKERRRKGLPLDKAEWMRRNGVVDPRTLDRWERDYELQVRPLDKEGLVPFDGTVLGDELDPDAVLKNLFELAKRSPQAAKYFLDFTKKEDNTSELSADVIIKAGNELIKQFKRDYADSGICPVCGGRKILPDEVCLDAEQGDQEEGEVGVVGLSPSATG